MKASRKKITEQCGNGHQPPVRTTYPQPVTATVEKGRLRIEPANIILKVSARQEAAWVCKTGTIEIRFIPNPKESPFPTSSFRAPKGGAALSGVPDRKTIRNTPYKYLVVVTQPDGIFISQDVSVQVTK